MQTKMFTLLEAELMERQGPLSVAEKAGTHGNLWRDPNKMT